MKLLVPHSTTSQQPYAAYPFSRGGKAPRFVVMASKDALGANLDRIQIIKACVDASGELRDKVFDVAWLSPIWYKP